MPVHSYSYQRSERCVEKVVAGIPIGTCLSSSRAHMPVKRVRRNRVSLLSRSRLRARPSVPDDASVALLFRAHPRLL